MRKEEDAKLIESRWLTAAGVSSVAESVIKLVVTIALVFSN